MSALMIARITVKDHERFQEYLARTQKVAAPPLHKGPPPGSPAAVEEVHGVFAT